ncbi:bifunctional diguanylate cyclase/phosphodiesterase [Amaricoccus macauensis]|uniref:bifunctional diguanylate cyclase/phosphodiesterase n=1 Tax=Amaricoccus macauensis TaxID=57001 RepID=UPI003C7DEBF6
MSKDLFTGRVVLPMACAILASIFMVVGFVIFTAQGQNRLEVESSSMLADTAVKVNKRHIARNLKDYAVWEDVYYHLHEGLDVDWAATDGNVGANVYEGLGYELAFVIDPAGETVYAVIEGTPQDTSAEEFVPEGLDQIIQTGTLSRNPAVGVASSSDGLLLIASMGIIPPSISDEALPSEERSSLVFAKRLDQSFLERMGNEYLLKGLKIIAADEAAAGATIPLASLNGETMGYLMWSPEQPGYELLRLLLPPLVISVIVLVAFAWLVVSNARRTTTALHDSARTVEAYARTLEESESRFRDVAEASSDWIWECDPQNRLIYLSTRFSEVTGIAAASLLGKRLESCFQPIDGLEDTTDLNEEMRKRQSFRDIRCHYRDARNRERNSRLAGRPIFDASGRFIGFRGTATDITEEVEAQARARHLALHDSLTGLPNRMLFNDRLNHALRDRRRLAAKVAVLCLDLDHFKEVNDTLGHAAGDLLLTSVADRLTTCARPTDTVARLGGDEFAIIQSDIEGLGDAEALSERIIEVMREPFEIEGHVIHVGVSIGAALSPNDGCGPEKLLKNADIALYGAKKAGRCTVRFFEPHMDLELQERKALEYDLRRAITGNEFVVHYQPVVDIQTEKVAGIEALIRWNHPERGVIEPEVFIPIAEDTGLIGPIGEWILSVACKQALQWPDIRMAVNVSAVQFRQRDIVGTIRHVLSDAGLPPSRLELEITESVLINDADIAFDVLTSLKETGMHIALDDFGTGFSSLACLNSFPFDKLKIDRSFVAASRTDPKSLAIVKAVLSLSRSLGLATTAEGVEAREQLDLLRAEGCDLVQGHLCGEPMSAEDLTKFLEEWEGIGRGGNSFAAA